MNTNLRLVKAEDGAPPSGHAATPKKFDSAQKLEAFLVPPECAIQDAVAKIDRNGKGIVLVVDARRSLLGTITDGDVRRAILAKDDLQSPIATLLGRKAGTMHPRPVVASPAMDDDELLAIMTRHTVRQLPVVDEVGKVVGLATWEDLAPEKAKPMEAVIMAGGFGKRLHPLTNNTPKPMLPIDGRPLMEVAVSRLQQAGVRRVSVTTHYLPEKIVEHFGDGSRFGVDLNYVNEENPLGTAGALRLLPPWEGTLLVMNGDILTDINFDTLRRYHCEHNATLTVAVRKYDFSVPYGVVETDGGIVAGIVEKPTMEFFVNAGIYLLEPECREYIPEGLRFDMPDLIRNLVADGRVAASFPIIEYWLDIGRPTDYEQAQQDMRNGRVAA
jgi:dTDP-glucose pyrophosphorylase/CBS domain-containing protein